APEATMWLRFDGPGGDNLLQSIELNGSEVPDIYLEPELVATLTRSSSDKQEIRELVKFKGIPAFTWKAIIAIEDQHFLDHRGLDPRGMARAFLINLKTLSLAQGGSTITQQLVKNLMARRSKNIFRKINEIFLALLLEASFEKEQILERYLNEVYLGQIGNFEVHGVAEGAKHFFNKRLEELNLAEIALLAGLIRGPAYYSPYRYLDRALERQKLVLRKMVETGQIAEEEAKQAMTLPINFAPPQFSANKAPYFTDYVKAELIRHLKERISEQEITQAGFRVYTTLDMNLSQAAQEAIASGVSSLEKKLKIRVPDRLEGALACVDHNNGQIKALIGGRSYAKSTFNRILNMKRQVGSTFKPVVYLAALQKGYDSNDIAFGAGYPVTDAPWTLVFDHGRQKWSPRNYEKEFMGRITLRNALAHSVNTVSARLAHEVGIKKIIETARALGIESDLPEVPSLSLGVAELSPIELLRVYSTLANRGVQDELTVIKGITLDDGTGYARFVYHPKQVIDQAPVDLLTEMMQSVFTYGTAKDAYKMGFERPAAGKTGTTSHHRDSWFAGFTPHLATVVWVGIDHDQGSNETARKEPSKTKLVLTGATSALPIWASFMKEALVGEPPSPFPLSEHLLDVLVDKHSGNIASSDCPSSQTLMEKYIRGVEPRKVACDPAWQAEQTEVVE
ncbi:MAG: PBP1A family penicillin-binding protein, partial [Bdellovibrionota bacterium]